MDTKSRDPIPGLPGSLPKLENATRDLFRLNGGQSIPVEARLSSEPSAAPAGNRGAGKAPSVPAEPAPSSASGRKQEASIIFSLEALMKSAAPAPSKSQDDEIDQQQLWDMQAVTPIFGTAQDQALLTTPLEPAPRSSTVDSMTVSSRGPGGRRWPVLVALAAGSALALGGFGFWSLRSSASAGEQTAAATPGGRQGTSTLPAATAALSATPANAGNGANAGLAPTTGAHAATTGGVAGGVTGGGENPNAAPGAAAADPNAVKAAPAAANSDPATTGEAGAGQVAKSDSAPNTGAEPAPANKEKEPQTHSTLPRATHTKPPAKLEPFDKSAAVAALNVATSKAESCPHTGGGKGKVQLTFASNGKVSSAEIVDGPFAASTPTGKCALRHFKAAKVPPFAGSPVTVAKSFKLP